MDHGEERSVIERFKATGDAGVLDPLFEQHMPVVRRMILPMVVNEADADDLTQEVFLRAARHLHAFEGRARFSTWVYRIAMNTTHSFLRRRREVTMPEDAPEPNAPPHDRPDRMVQAYEFDGAVGRALEHLTPSLRAAVSLVLMEDMPIRDAARIEGCTVATMYWRIHKARRDLRESLREHLAP